jgi:sulfatase maturation enzyme AslB (radical SAM superfamily)
LHLNSAASCCRAYPESFLENETVQDRITQWKKESDLLTQGVELPGCKICWDDEKQNKLSYRQLNGQDNTQNNTQLNRIEIMLSNLCNQMCSYCSPKYSSVWEESIANYGNFKQVSNTAVSNLQISNKIHNNQNRLLQIRDYIQTCNDDSIHLTLLGGEPLMQINSLQQLLAVNQNKINTLSIVTNLNPPKAKFLEWMIDNFPNNKLYIQVSLDATPEYNHVPRAGFELDQFQQNLEYLKEQQIKIEFLATMSATSIFDLPNFLSWIHNHEYLVKFFSLNNPSCLNPEVVPLQFRQQILKQINVNMPAMVEKILNCDQSTVDLKLFEQYNYLTQYFTRTNTDLTKINNPLFQEYWQWLTERFEK